VTPHLIRCPGPATRARAGCAAVRLYGCTARAACTAVRHALAVRLYGCTAVRHALAYGCTAVRHALAARLGNASLTALVEHGGTDHRRVACHRPQCVAATHATAVWGRSEVPVHDAPLAVCKRASSSRHGMPCALLVPTQHPTAAARTHQPLTSKSCRLLCCSVLRWWGGVPTGRASWPPVGLLY
jgi:hypothetical protein